MGFPALLEWEAYICHALPSALEPFSHDFLIPTRYTLITSILLPT